MEPALPLDYVEFDPHVEHTGDISEMSAEQYLSWVRTQASSLPSGIPHCFMSIVLKVIYQHFQFYSC